MNNPNSNSNNSNPMKECEQIIQQLIQQTSQSHNIYEQLKQQEQKNAMQLQKLISKERQAIQTIHTALKSHQQAISEMQQVADIFRHFEANSQQMFSNQNIDQIGSGQSQHNSGQYN